MKFIVCSTELLAVVYTKRLIIPESVYETDLLCRDITPEESLSLYYKIKNKLSESTEFQMTDTTFQYFFFWLQTSSFSFKDNLNPTRFFSATQLLMKGSVKALLHQLSVYTGNCLKSKFALLRKTLIHTLSIFFGLCCSNARYIYNAITGTSSHPCPVSC